MELKKRIKSLGVGILLIGGLGLVGLHSNVIRLPFPVQYSNTVSGVNFAADVELVGAAHNVFVGKVVRKLGNDVQDGIAFTSYEVAVMSNVKGKLQGTVTVFQQGGYKNGFLHVMRSDDSPKTGIPLLEVGSTYLLASRHRMEKDWHYLLPTMRAEEIISSDPEFGSENDMSAIGGSPRIAALRAAYINEVVPSADIAHDKDFNSFGNSMSEKTE